MSFSEWLQIREGIERTPTWFMATLLIILLLLALTRVKYGRFFGLVLQGFTENRFVGQLLREEKVFTQGGAVLLSLITLFSIGLFGYQLTYTATLSDTNQNGLSLYLIIVMGLFTFITVKLILYNVVGFILNIQENTVVCVFNVLMFNWILGILLLPLVVLVEFLTIASPSYFIIVGISLIVLFYIWRTGKALYLATTTTSHSLFYIIFYLCTLEILPLVILLKLSLIRTS